jgi:hypothetical protein
MSETKTSREWRDQQRLRAQMATSVTLPIGDLLDLLDDADLADRVPLGKLVLMEGDHE